MVAGPVDRGERVVDGGRVGRLRAEPVVDREHRDVGIAAEPSAGLVVGVEVADDEPAPVQVDQRRPRPLPCRPVQPGRDATGVEVAHLTHHDPRGVVDQVDGHGAEGLAGGLRGALVHRRVAGGGDEVEDGGGAGVEGHGAILPGSPATPAPGRPPAPGPAWPDLAMVTDPFVLDHDQSRTVARGNSVAAPQVHRSSHARGRRRSRRRPCPGSRGRGRVHGRGQAGGRAQPGRSPSTRRTPCSRRRPTAARR